MLPSLNSSCSHWSPFISPIFHEYPDSIPLHPSLHPITHPMILIPHISICNGYIYMYHGVHQIAITIEFPVIHHKSPLNSLFITQTSQDLRGACGDVAAREQRGHLWSTSLGVLLSCEPPLSCEVGNSRIYVYVCINCTYHYISLYIYLYIYNIIFISLYHLYPNETDKSMYMYIYIYVHNPPEVDMDFSIIFPFSWSFDISRFYQLQDDISQQSG